MHIIHQLHTLLQDRSVGLQFRTDPHHDRFFALQTLRRDGSTRSTPIWLAPAGERWYAYTPGRSWKVRRIRRDRRVWVAAATFHGEPRGPWQPGHARILPRSQRRRAQRAMTAKYGNQFRLFRLIMIINAGRRYGGPPVGLEITLDADPVFCDRDAGTASTGTDRGGEAGAE